MNNIIVQERKDQFAEIVAMIQHTRSEVVRLANASLIDLYWKIGKYISNKIAASEWGDGVVKQLADYIERTNAEAKGFSDKNLWRMKQFYESQLDRQIDSALYERNALGAPKLSPVLREIAPQAEQVFRDQYVMEFIGGKEYEHENSMKAALVKQMKNFILEFGKDFLFIDEEYRLQVGNSDFRIDLLFYHRELQCLVAFELKMEKFKPEHLGQLNFYLEALDRDVKKPKENPSIGVLLCKDKDDAVVEYALSRSLSPTMVAEYQLCLPDKALLQKKLQEMQESIADSGENNI